MQKKLSIMIFPLLLVFTMQISCNSSQEDLEKLGFQIITENINYFDFNLTDINGNRVRLSSHEGKVILLTFWATWCPPCRSKMPTLEVLHKKMTDSNFIVIAVNIQENGSVVRDFIHSNGYTFPVALDANGEVARQYRIRSVPTTYIIDKKGKIAGVSMGTKDWSSDDAIKIFRELSK